MSAIPFARFVLAAAAFAGGPALAEGAEPNPTEQGRKIVQNKCARCHAIGNDGASPHPQAPPFRTVVTRYPPEDLAESLAEGIVSGHPDMPQFTFQPAEIGAVISYLQSLRSSAETPNGGKPAK